MKAISDSDDWSCVKFIKYITNHDLWLNNCRGEIIAMCQLTEIETKIKMGKPKL